MIKFIGWVAVIAVGLYTGILQAFLVFLGAAIVYLGALISSLGGVL